MGKTPGRVGMAQRHPQSLSGSEGTYLTGQQSYLCGSSKDFGLEYMVEYWEQLSMEVKGVGGKLGVVHMRIRSTIAYFPVESTVIAIVGADGAVRDICRYRLHEGREHGFGGFGARDGVSSARFLASPAGGSF